MLYDKKMFLMKIVQIKRNKEDKNKEQKKSRKIRERKNWGKIKKKQKCINEICQDNYQKKRFIQSFKPREEILKLKMNIKDIQ